MDCPCANGSAFFLFRNPSGNQREFLNYFRKSFRSSSGSYSCNSCDNSFNIYSGTLSKISSWIPLSNRNFLRIFSRQFFQNFSKSFSCFSWNSCWNTSEYCRKCCFVNFLFVFFRNYSWNFYGNLYDSFVCDFFQ